MSSPSPQVIAYLTKQLSRNPIHESSDIIQFRAKALRLAPRSDIKSTSDEPTADRQQVRQQIESIRADCFASPVEQLLSQLNALPLNDFPDLAATAARLRVILASRAKLPALSQQPDFDGDFFSCFKTLLTSPAREVTLLREQVLTSFRTRKLRRRGQGMIRLLKRELPELYALESDWLEMLLRYKRAKHSIPVTKQTAASVETSGSHPWIWVLVMLAVFGFKAARYAWQDKPDERPKQTYRSPSPQRPSATNNRTITTRSDNSHINETQRKRIAEIDRQNLEAREERLRQRSQDRSLGPRQYEVLPPISGGNPNDPNSRPRIVPRGTGRGFPD